MDAAHQNLAGLVVIWLWGLSMASVLRWFERRFIQWLRPPGWRQWKKQESKRIRKQLEKAYRNRRYWD
jgi:hypothetical protein